MCPQDSRWRRLAHAGGWLGLLLALSTCGPDHELDCFKSTGPVETTHRPLAAFHTLIVNNNVDVTLVPDTVFFAEVRTGRNLQTDLELQVDDSTLVIRNTSRCNWVRRYDVPRVVLLHLPTLLNLYQRGENLINTAGVLRADRLFCHLDGAGDVDLNLDTDYLWTDLYQLGNLRVRGRARELLLKLGGLGSFRGEQLHTQQVWASTNFDSAGDVLLTSPQALHLDHQGTGTCYYAGHPATLLITGPGKVVQTD